MRLVLLLADTIDVNPTSAGMPGASFVLKLLNWLCQVALWASAASVMLGAAGYGVFRETGNGYNASRGRNLAIGGAVGAVLAALADTIINGLFTAAR